jgi:hypothetical protein
LCSLKRKVEPAALTPAKALKASTMLRTRTPTDDATWLARYRVVTERLKSMGSFVQAGESVEGAVGAEEAARRPELVEVAPDATGLGQSGGDDSKPGSTMRTLETVEAIEAATAAHNARKVDVGETRNAGKAPQDAGKEGEVLPGPQTGREEPPCQPP